MSRHVPVKGIVCLFFLFVGLFSAQSIFSQAFDFGVLNFNGNGSVSKGTSLQFGPDGRLYVVELKGKVKIYSIQRNGPADYEVVETETLLDVENIPNHNDDGTSNAGVDQREATGIVVGGTASNPVVYVGSSDERVGGPSGDKNLDTNSGVITRLTWVGNGIDDPSGYWDVVDIVRGLPRSEENHANNGMELWGDDYLLVASGGFTNGGAPSTKFAFITEYSLAAAVLAVDLNMLESMPIQTDPTSGRKYIYDIPTVDDPTRPNVNGIVDPNDPGYDGVDINDPWGGNDGLNMTKLQASGPIQMFSSGYRNTYDLVLTESGAVYVTDNGANGGWGGLPINENNPNTVSNDYPPGEPGSSNPVGGEQVDNKDHLNLVTTDISTYVFGSVYGGHPCPIRANPGTPYTLGDPFPYNPGGAGLYTKLSPNGIVPSDNDPNDFFRTQILDPSDPNFAAQSLPVDWPPVEVADPAEADFRAPGSANPDGPDDIVVTTWQNNTNGIDEYTASNFGGAMKGNLIAGKSGGSLHRVVLNPDGSLNLLEQNKYSTQGGNPLGITCNSDTDTFPGTIWVATFDSRIVMLEPNDFVICVLPGDSGYDPQADYDSDGFTNQDEEDNGTDPCSGASQPNDYDGDSISDLNDLDDDNDGINDDLDPFQIGGSFDMPINNELFSNVLDDQGNEIGYLGIGLTGLMNNGDPNPNYLDWLDVVDAGPNPNDIMGGAIGAITVNMTGGTALGTQNDQEKGFQFGVNIDEFTGPTVIETGMLGFVETYQLYEYTGDGQVGFQIGDGTQSNFIQLVVTKDGVLLQDEVNDVPNANPPFEAIAVADRPSSDETVRLQMEVDPASGTVTGRFAIGGGSWITVGTLVAQGALLDALQNSNTPLAVGIMGTSNDPAAEVQGTWDYFTILGTQPYVLEEIPDFQRMVNSPDEILDLSTFFDDDQGMDNLTFTVSDNSDPSVGAVIDGTQLTISFPASPTTSDITIRATDAANSFVEQTFTVTVFEDPIPIIRVNAGDALIAATDDGPDWLANEGNGAQSGSYGQGGFSYTNNTGNISTNNVTGRHSSVPNYVPQDIYTKERWDLSTGDEMLWSFPLPDGTYEVRLYFGNGCNCTQNPGDRVFDVNIEGVQVINGLDLSAKYGHKVGAMEAYQTTVSDGSLDIEFLREVENPLINGIEILSVGPVDLGPLAITPIPDQSNAEGQEVNLTVNVSGGLFGVNYDFSIQGAPEGVEIDPTNGLIYGTIALGAGSGGPNSDGIYTTTVTVSQQGGDTESVSFTWTVNDLSWADKDEDENYVARHECSFVKAGEKFFMFGGREQATRLDMYDHANDSWSTGATAPIEFNHFQAVEYQGYIWVIGAFKDNGFPTEEPADRIYLYDPVNNLWIEGPEIPVSRRRGSTGLVVYNDEFYITCGNTIGHDGGYVPWFDKYNPATNTWTQLPDAPRARDHFHAAVVGDKMYLAGGRLSGGDGGVFAPLIPEVDVYDFTNETWSTIPADLPTPRAAAAVVNFQEKVFVIGGEGNGQAYDNTEALDPSSNTWSVLDPLNTQRHGTQAVVSGNGIHIAGGSPSQGGGNMKNWEVYGEDNPDLTPIQASTASVPDAVTFSPTDATKILTLSLQGGDQGKWIETIQLTGDDAGDFSLTAQPNLPILIGANGSLDLEITYSGTPPASASLEMVLADGTTLMTDLLGTDGINAQPNVTNPGDQINQEGDVVSLPITADDGDEGFQNLTFSAANLPPDLTIDPNTGEISGTIAQPMTGTGPFIEENGLVIVEVESMPIVPGWIQGTDGDITYYQGDQNNFSDPSNGHINYQIQISQPGIYRFNWRSNINSGDSGSDSNDSWLKFPNNDSIKFFGYKGPMTNEADIDAALQLGLNNDPNSLIVFPKGSPYVQSNTSPNGQGGDGFFKAYMNSLDQWPWVSRTSDNDPHNIFIKVEQPGIYTMTIGVRSKGHAIDKFGLYKLDEYNNQDLFDAPPSAQFTPGALEDSPYDVTVTVTDDGDPEQSTDINFTWTIAPPISPTVIGASPLTQVVNSDASGFNVTLATTEMDLPYAMLDPNTVNNTTVQLLLDGTGAVVTGTSANTTAEGDGIVLSANDLAANTTYRWEIGNGVQDMNGNPIEAFSTTFTTGSLDNVDPITVDFQQVDVATGANYTALKIGPDGKLYALTQNGFIHRWELTPDGSLTNQEILDALHSQEGDRLALGLVFDPAADANNLTAYVSHSDFAFSNAAPWSGKVTRLSGANLEIVEDLIINLPRSAFSHATNGMDFGPDGALYISQGHTSAAGSPGDPEYGSQPERLLSAAILRADLGQITNPPLDVQTANGGNYDPFAADAPVTIYASGIRNALHLIWHSNQQLYVPTNGAESDQNTPALDAGSLPLPLGTRIDESFNGQYSGPAVPGVSLFFEPADYLYRVVEDGYYGHPNPARGEFVLNGGNPTAGSDPGEITDYPVGTLPDRNYRGYAYEFGDSEAPTGIIEYQSDAFGGALQNKLLVTRYNQGFDILALSPGTNNPDIMAAQAGLSGFSGFTGNPISLVENPATGNLYVSEYNGNKIILLKAFGTTVNGNVTLQGRSDHSADFTIELFSAGTSDLIGQYNVTTDANGDFTLDGLPTGAFDLYIKQEIFLRKKVEVTLNSTVNTVNLGELLAGDCNNNNEVEFFDFSILLASYNLSDGEDGYDYRADLNGNNEVDFFDFSLLLANYNVQGD